MNTNKTIFQIATELSFPGKETWKNWTSSVGGCVGWVPSHRQWSHFLPDSSCCTLSYLHRDKQPAPALNTQFGHLKSLWSTGENSLHFAEESRNIDSWGNKAFTHCDWVPRIQTTIFTTVCLSGLEILDSLFWDRAHDGVLRSGNLTVLWKNPAWLIAGILLAF